MHHSFIFSVWVLASSVQSGLAFVSAQVHSRSIISASFQMTLIERVSDEVSSALGRQIILTRGNGGGFAGGGGASTSVLIDEATQGKYFLKSSYGDNDMLKAEYHGVKAMSDTNTIKVPKPIAHGKCDSQTFVVFEYVNFCSGGSGQELGINLAKMHKRLSPSGKFGFDMDNTIGATPQPNGWCDEWSVFWDEHRLGHMLTLTHDAGFAKVEIDALRAKTKELLSHKPEPSLLHGDLWGGNKGYAKGEDGITVPVIFDPAPYYVRTFVFIHLLSRWRSCYSHLPFGSVNRVTVKQTLP
jgi:fructosamine-3-kinase